MTGLPNHVADAVLQSGRRIVVTGAGGWLGMATLDLLKHVLGSELQEAVFCFGSRERILRLVDGTEIPQRPLSEIGQLEQLPTMILHLAFLTKDKASAMDEADYRQANCDMASKVLRAAEQIGADRIFLASSGAAKLADETGRPVDFRLYGEMKREDEDRFAEWAAADPRRCVAIGRIFNISGPYINKHDSYALACFIVDALAGRPILVRAPHPVIRGYVSIGELVSLILAILVEGEPGVIRFETGGEPMELKAVADGVAAQFEGATVNRTAITKPVSDAYLGDDTSYRKILDRYRIDPISFEQQVIETARYLEALQIGVVAGVRAC